MQLFDTLQYANRLQTAGVERAQAEAHAEALAGALESCVGELATKADLHELESRLLGTLQQGQARADCALREFEQRTGGAMHELEERIGGAMHELEERTGGALHELEERTGGALRELEQRIGGALRELELRLTVKLGVMLAVAIGVLATLSRLGI